MTIPNINNIESGAGGLRKTCLEATEAFEIPKRECYSCLETKEAKLHLALSSVLE